ncbi:MAG: CBS domain-containing protein, partial [Chloroflexota bacterium]
TTLSVWEMNYLLSKLTVSEVMTKNVITVAEDTPIEEAARIMADNKIGGLPVVKGARVVGIITETNLFKMFLELMGAREQGVRVTALIEDKPGMLAKLTKAITDAGGNFIAFGQFVGEDVNTRVVTFKVKGLGKDKVKKVTAEIANKIWDIREA